MLIWTREARESWHNNRILEDLDIKRLVLSFEDLLDGGQEKCNFLSLEAQ